MPEIHAGRFTARYDEPFVVFLIGMRVNKPFAFRKWLPVFNAFPEMLKVLYTHPEKGFLGGEFFYKIVPIAPVMISYWKSFEALEQFARSKDDPHLAAWRAFNQTIGSNGTVGIWHETYAVTPGNYEVVYGNMPAFGLGSAAKSLLPVSQQRSYNRARDRMSGVASADSEAAPTL